MLTGASNSTPDTLRVDAPHHIVSARTAGKVEPQAVITDHEPVGSASGMQRQASELADRLRTRQRELDRREAQLNARAEALEQETRRQRLSDQLQQDALKEQAAMLAESQESARQQAEDARNEHLRTAEQLALENERLKTESRALSNREVSLEDRQNELASQQKTLSEREAAIDDRERELESRVDELARRELRQQRNQAAEPGSLVEVTRLREQLQLANEQLRQKIGQADHQRIRWEQRQAEAVRDEASRRQRQNELHQQKLQQVEERLQNLIARKESLDLRETTIEKSKIQVAEAQRETLEMRIIVEELWARLSSTVAPAELSQGYAKAQQRLQQHFQLTLNTLDEQAEQLRSAGIVMEKKFAELKTQTESLQQWHQQRLEEVETQAARLIARENELHRETRQLVRAEAAWQTEKRNLEIQLHQLAGEQSVRAA